MAFDFFYWYSTKEISVVTIDSVFDHKNKSSEIFLLVLVLICYFFNKKENLYTLNIDVAT